MHSSNHPVQLEVTTLATDAPYQTLAINLPDPKHPIAPEVLPRLTLPPDLDLNREVILFGQGPAWLYSHLIHRCHSAAWIGCYDARSQQVVVVQSRIPERRVGDALPVALNRSPCPAILIGGPPNSGKSVLSNALRLSLIRTCPQRRFFLHRANWDGEGNWAYESNNPTLIHQLVQRNEYRMHEKQETAKLIPAYFSYHAKAANNLRSLVDCVLVDVGGIPQPEKAPLVQQCTHYIIISRLPEAVEPWHKLCQPHLQPLAVIHSVRDRKYEILRTEPVLELIAGPWQEGETLSVPECLLQAIVQRLSL